MRADRLISILMLLQMHKKLTASELSKKLEVSVRTIYRDIDILSGIGVPIFADKGINGGIKLLGDYKTSLTGINKKELFSLLIPTGDKIFEDLGIEDLKYSTMLKILGNSSHNQIEELENIQNYIYIDMYTWNEPNISLDIDILSILQNAVWNSKSLKLLYRKVDETKEIAINPLGLVCKRGVWYLVAADKEIIKTYKVTSIESASLMNDTFIRPYDFNLKTYWKNSTSNFKNLIPKYTFTFKVSPSILNHIKERQFITISKTMFKENEIYLNIKFDSVLQGIEFAFGYGKDIKIIEPIEAISEIKKRALEVIDLY
ncbi:WYL domain-containing protein [Clostridium sp. OS1-26]|uniref:helix-turn-helix transcriptional regulator n=1 Tax=Clostridium sp. OS1-26 TaxID=3070681 RepID=UPI0027E04642|nr:WYL domain-containing protein [Clostridium sp. OS1-26]WML32796.1 WYL domain-containing protein [Clostridium sp. OS1-26]